MSKPADTILVGFDGSVAAYAALDWAIDEAKRRDADVVALLASGAAMVSTPLMPMMTDWPDDAATSVLRGAVAHAATRSPETRVRTTSSLSGAAGALVEGSASARLVVIGGERHNPLSELALGATAPQVAGHARCPVVVVPRGGSTVADAPVVVGVDGSSEAQTALEFAFGHAEETGRPLVAVHSWWLDAPDGLDLAVISPSFADRLERKQQDLVDEAIGTWKSKFPEVSVERVLVQGNPVEALLETAKQAHLLVVGSRGHGGFAGLFLGSVSQGLIHAALPCPLAVVHASDRLDNGRLATE